MSSRAAIISPSKLGDGLIILAAAQFLHRRGYAIDVYNPFLCSLAGWFPHFQIIDFVPMHEWEGLLQNYDEVICLHGDIPLCHYLTALRMKGKLPHLRYLFPYPFRKVSQATERDFLFLADRPAVDNVLAAMNQFFRENETRKDNGITPPSSLQYRRYSRRIVIHPTSSLSRKNWWPSRFIQLAKRLKKSGYDPLFFTGPGEGAVRELLQRKGMTCVTTCQLKHLAAWIYESGYLVGNDSGLGHLASCLGIPSLIISGSERGMRIWKPGWEETFLVVVSRHVPNIKGLRLRDKIWQLFVSVRRVEKKLGQMFEKYPLPLL